MRTYWTILAHALVSTGAFLGTCRHSIARAEVAATAVPSCCQGAGTCKLADAIRSEKEDPSPRISFDSTVSDLGQVGVGTGNLCEFQFGNSGYAPLKVTSVKAACGCTAFRAP